MITKQQLSEAIRDAELSIEDEFAARQICTYLLRVAENLFKDEPKPTEVTMPIEYCGGDYSHDQHPYDWSGIWKFCEGKE